MPDKIEKIIIVDNFICLYVILLSENNGHFKIKYTSTILWNIRSSIKAKTYFEQWITIITFYTYIILLSQF